MLMISSIFSMILRMARFMLIRQEQIIPIGYWDDWFSCYGDLLYGVNLLAIIDLYYPFDSHVLMIKASVNDAIN